METEYNKNASVIDNKLLDYTGNGQPQTPPVTTTPIPTTPITTSSVSSTQQPFKITPSIPSASAAALSASALGQSAAYKDDLTSELAKKEKEAEIERNAAKNNYQTIIDDIAKTQGERNVVEKDFGVNTKEDTYNKATQTLNDSKRRQDVEIRALESANLTDFGKQAAIRDINRKYAFEQADLSILQANARGDFETAQKQADRFTELKLEPLKLRLDTAKQFYEDNKEELSDAQKNLLSAKIRSDERIYDKFANDVKTLSDTKLSLLKSAAMQNAPASVQSAIGMAKTPEEAIVAAGSYGTDILDRQIKLAQIQKLYAEAADKKSSINAIRAVASVDPDSPTYIDDLLSASAGGATLTGDQTKPISKALTVIGQIDSLQSSLEGQDTGPLVGILRSNNPYDVQAQQIKGQLQAILPNLARGVYGEVGVLTDNDIANYRKTIGNLQSPAELNDLLLSMTLKTVQNGIDDQLEVMASAGRDVSAFRNLENRLGEQVNDINGRIGLAPEGTTSKVTPTDVSNATISGLKVTFPNGGSIIFPSQAALDEFKNQK